MLSYKRGACCAHAMTYRERPEAKRERLASEGRFEATRDAQFGGPSRATIRKRAGDHAWTAKGLCIYPRGGETVREDEELVWMWAVSKPEARPHPDTELVITSKAGLRAHMRVIQVTAGVSDSARIRSGRRASGAMRAVVTMMHNLTAPPAPAPAPLHSAPARGDAFYADAS